MKVKITKDRGPSTTMQDMKVGQLARIQDECHPLYNGMVVLCGGAGVISLSHPETVWTTWARQQLPTIRVRILPTGAEVTLIQEEEE